MAAEQQNLRQRREQLGITTARLAELADISIRSVQKAEAGQAGRAVLSRITATLASLEAGEVPVRPAHRPVVRWEIRPGVHVTIDADDAARLGDLRAVEDAVLRLLERHNNGGHTA